MKTSFDPTSYTNPPESRSRYSNKKHDCYSVFENKYNERSTVGFDFPRRSDKIKEIKPVLSFEINGTEFLVANELRDIVYEIIESKEILKLDHDWDMENGSPVDPILYLKAIDFLLLYSTYILNIERVVINAPEINLCRNGSIDLSWRTNGARMLINIKYKKDALFATFYGYHKNNNLPIEGFIDMVKIDPYLASWMTELK